MHPALALRRLWRGQFANAFAELHPRAANASNRTALNRYPEIFAAAAQAVPNARRILSFGCSTGEECASLSLYFPAAQIIGADINCLNVWRARQKVRLPNIQFIYSRDATLAALAPFDAIFAMAVFRKSGNDPADYPFTHFAERVGFLDTLLAPGGLLAVAAAVYRFADTPTARKYIAIPITRNVRRPVQNFSPGGSPVGIYRDELFQRDAGTCRA